MCAEHYENPTMLSRVTAKNVGDVFLRHTVYATLQRNTVAQCGHRVPILNLSTYGFTLIPAITSIMHQMCIRIYHFQMKQETHQQMTLRT